MQTDFFNAFERHFKDAELLFNNSRWANAGQLYGYSAECGIKCLMEAFGMNLDPTGEKPENPKDQVHLPQLLIRYESYRKDYDADEFCLPEPNPFSSWSITDRYGNESNFNEMYVNPYKEGIVDIQALIYRAKREGLL
ncbi:hypothetical protein LQZ19_17945 [Treponema primitia]|uniref:hypothetical protein n=1 Tax=Treponema primitia TaxID=88058 RepID=UPI003980003E